MAWLAKGINDAKKYRQKLRRLKNSREERVSFSAASSFSFSSSLSKSRDDQGADLLFDLSILDVHLQPTCYPPPDVRASVSLSSFSCPPPYLLLCSFSLSLSLSLYLSCTYIYTHRHTHYFFPSPLASSSFFLPRVFCQEPSRAEASRTALKQKRSDVKCDYESCESSSRTRMLR